MPMSKLLGKQIAEFAGRHTTAITAGLTIAAAGSGFAKGIGDRDVSSNFYEMTTGTADIDNYALGRDLSLRSALMPLPLSVVSRGGVGAVPRVTATTGAIGAVGGGVMGALMAQKHRIGGGLLGAGIGMTAGALAGFRGSSQGFINGTTVSDATRARTYNNQMPLVDGSLVLGAYNTRMGGY